MATSTWVNGSRIFKFAVNQHTIRLGWVVLITILIATLLAGQVPARAESAVGGGQAPAESKLQLPKEFGKPGSVRVVPAFGAATDQLELTVPPGRRNIEPQLMLNYNSLGGLGSLGMGWSLETGSVELWRGDGLPNVGTQDSFSFSIAGLGGQLINTGGGVYRAKFENTYREFRRSTLHGGWEMYNGEGALHRFGGTAASRIEGKQWMLDLVQDQMGNTITYTYMRQGDVLYISEIRYTGYAPEGDTGKNLVKFEYETRPDVRVDLGLSVRQEKSLRLKQVSMYAGGELARRYTFSYITSPVNGLSLLDQVALVGADDVSTITLRHMDYGTRNLGWAAGVTHTWPAVLSDADGLDTGTRIVDVNGDGFADLVKNDGWVHLGLGNGQFTQQADTTWSTSLRGKNVQFAVPSGDRKGLENGIRFLDVNSDGLPDLLIAQMDRRQIYLNTGRGWSDSETVYSGGIGTTGQQWSTGTYGLSSIESQSTFSAGTERFALIGPNWDPKGVQLADVNGDGRIDIIWSFNRTPSLYNLFCSVIEPTCYPVTNVRGVYLNTGTGWVKNQALTQSLASVDFFIVDAEWRGYDLLDVNGDGLADLVRTLGGQTLEVRLNTGSGWALDGIFSGSLSANNLVTVSDGKAQGLMPLDLNDDGLVDYIKANDTSRKVYLNTGKGWALSQALTDNLNSLGISFATSFGKGTGTQPIDINGDGLVDMVQSKGGATRIFSAAGQRAGLLSQVTSTLGEVTRLTWGISTQFDNRDEAGVYRLPAALPVVTGVVLNDGRGNAYATNYAYAGGLFTGRQLRGFRQSEQLMPSGLKNVSRYYQDEGLVGLVETAQSLDATNTVRLERSAVYQQVDAGHGVTQSYLSQSDDQSMDPGGARHSATSNKVNAQLNYTVTVRDPEVGVEGDETIISYAWAQNPKAGIWSLISKVQVHSMDGTLLQEKITRFDDQLENLAVKGLPSQVLELVEKDRYVSGSMGYDQYGNVIKITDRNNNVSTFTYDADTATFRVGAADAEGRVTASQYDPRFGQPLEITAPGGRTTRSEYDAFGRVTKVTLPGDETSPYGTQSITYSPVGQAASQYYTIAKTETAGKPDTLDTTYYLDGLGRIYRAEQEADGGRKVVVMSEFDDAGNVKETTRPFFEGDPQSWSHVERDELYRPVRVTDQDGSQVSMAYAGLRVDVTDARGVTTSYDRNVSGDVTRVVQRNGGVEQTTDYTYDLLGQMIGIRDAIGEETHITYDGLGRRTSLVDPNAGAYAYRYDDAGNLVEQQGPDGSVTSFSYDRTGSLTGKLFSDGSRQSYAYNAAGDPFQVEDAAGRLTLEYDARGRATSQQRELDGKTYQMRFAYDSLNRITALTYPDDYAIHYKYGAGGNLLEVVDGKKTVIATGMSYNAAGQLLSIEYGNGVTSNLSYDDLLRMTANDTRTADQEAILDLDYEYDPNGNILKLVDNAFEYSQHFEYDDLGRLVQASGKYGVESYEYDLVGNLLRKGSTIYGYDPEHPQRLTCGVDSSLVSQAEGGAGQENAGAYQEDAGAAADTVPAANTVYIPLISLGNASKAQAAANQSLPKADGIGHNPHAGLCETFPALSAEADDNTKDTGNDKAGGASNPNLARSYRVVYDEAGNAIEKGGTRYEYDAENHLVRILDAKGKVIAENVYDAGGQRVVQSTPNGKTIYIDGVYEVSKTHVSRHIYAGSLLIASVVQPRSLADASEGPTPNGFNALAGTAGLMGLLVCVPFANSSRKKWLARLQTLRQAFHAHPYRMIVLLVVLNAVVSIAAAPEFNAQASLLQKGAEKTYYYHSNHLGSVNAITDDTGKLVERREYKPYGESFEWTGPNSGPREFLTTFQGQKYDDASALYYMGARHYDPEIGRFLAADTQVSDPSNPSNLNRYAFVAGNPIRYIDPTGHSWCDFVLAGLIVLAVIALAIVTADLALGAAAIGTALITIGVCIGIGVVVGGIIALATGNEFGSLSFWEDVAAGAMFGAVVGAGIAILPALAAVAGASFSASWGFIFAKITAGAVLGAATGALSFGVQNLAISMAGGTPERLFSTAFFSAIASGAGWGAAFAFGSVAAASWIASIHHGYRLFKVLSLLNNYVLQPGIGKGIVVSVGATVGATWWFTSLNTSNTRYTMVSGLLAFAIHYIPSLASQAYAFCTAPLAG